MVNIKTVTSILNNLRDYRQKLTILADFDLDEFIEDFTKVESAKHLLQISIESCLDLAHHIIADEGFRTPRDSYDSFVVLQEEGIIPTEYMPILRQMVSFRNRVVHLYWDVEDEVVYEILQNNLDDFDHYVKYILDFTNLSFMEEDAE
ncbi:MAG: DUF86 domain-containing protein [Caldilineaceae bacterium]